VLDERARRLLLGSPPWPPPRTTNRHARKGRS